MSGPTSSPDWLSNNGGPAYGTFPRPRFTSANSSHDSRDSTIGNDAGGDVSPTHRPSPSRKVSKHIEFRKFLKRPHLTDSQRTLSDALRSAKSREEQETLLPDDYNAGSDGCFNGQGEPVSARDLSVPDANANLKIYFNIHR